MQYNNKRISFVIILVSILMLIFGFMTKDYDDPYYRKKKYDVPLDLYDVSLFGWDIAYTSFMLFFIIMLGVGIYLIVFTSDDSFRKIFTKRGFYLSVPYIFKSIRTKYENFEKSNIEVVPDHIPENVNRKVFKTVEIFTIIALLFTFYMAVTTGFSLWFFIILAYYYNLIWKPKSIKEIRAKMVLNPLFYMVIFAFSESSRVVYFNFFYQMSRHILPYIICVVIIYFSQKYKLKKQSKFSFKNGLFFLSVLCFIVAVLTYIVDYKIQFG